MSHRTLVPFDKSDPALKALDEAIEEHGEGELIALTVIDADVGAYGMQGGAAEDLQEQTGTDAADRLAEAESRANQHGVALTTAVETGQPSETIVAYAEANDIDRIVMGSHGRSGVSKILLGSVAENVVQESPVTVTVVR